MQERVSSTFASPAPRAGSHAGSSSATTSRKSQTRKRIELTLSDSSDEDGGGGDLRAKIARLEAENARLRGGVKAEPGVKVEDEGDENRLRVLSVHSVASPCMQFDSQSEALFSLSSLRARLVVSLLNDACFHQSFEDWN